MFYWHVFVSCYIAIMIPFSGTHTPYSHLLTDLQAGTTAYVRIKENDYNNGEAYVTPSHTIQVPKQCRPPTSPPRDVRVQSTGPTQIRVTWSGLSQSEWNCDRIWYVLKYSSSITDGYKNFTERDSQAVFDSQPFTQWTFSMQSVNEAGASGWSQVATGSTLQGTPDRVKDLRCYPIGTNAVQVRCQAPDHPNGQITGYELTGMCRETQEDRQTVNIAGGATNYQLEGLSAHGKYLVTVAAKTTAVGEPAKIEIETDTGAPKAPPRSIIAESNTPTSADLAWQAPACLDTNGDITEYEYEIIVVDEWALNERQTSSTTEKRANIAMLTPFTTYNVRMRAYTTKGPGPWSIAQTVRTKPTDRPSPPPKLATVDTQPTEVQLCSKLEY